MRGLGSMVAIAMVGALAACSGGSSVENPRTAKFKSIAKANKAIGDELKKETPSMGVIATNAQALDTHARELPSWFPATGPEQGMKTAARAEIWQKPAEFKATAARFAAATAALQSAAAAGDLATVRTAAAAVGPTCKACHDNFRMKD